MATLRAVAAEDPPKPKLIRRLEAQRDRLEVQRARHRARPLTVRVLYIVVGFTVLFGGLVMLITPGPAFIVIPIGLAVLSLEFAWAQRLLDRALEQGELARRKAARATRPQRILAGIAAILAVAAGLTAWAMLGDIPLLPF